MSLNTIYPSYEEHIKYRLVPNKLKIIFECDNLKLYSCQDEIDQIKSFVLKNKGIFSIQIESINEDNSVVSLSIKNLTNNPVIFAKLKHYVNKLTQVCKMCNIKKYQVIQM